MKLYLPCARLLVTDKRAEITFNKEQSIYCMRGK